MLTTELSDLAADIGSLLRTRKETVVVAEGSAGGLISAALLSIPGASAYYLGGTIIYTMAARRALLGDAIEVPAKLRGATEAFAQYLAHAAAVRIGATWGVSEAGAAGPPNPYGDPAGHAWVGVWGPAAATRHLLTGLDDRPSNMVAFALGALTLLRDTIARAPAPAPAPAP